MRQDETPLLPTTCSVEGTVTKMDWFLLAFLSLFPPFETPTLVAELETRKLIIGFRLGVNDPLQTARFRDMFSLATSVTLAVK